MSNDVLPAGALLLDKKAPPKEPIVTEEITLTVVQPGITTTVVEGRGRVFLNFDVPTGESVLKRYKVPFAADTLPSYLAFIQEQYDAWVAGLLATAEAMEGNSPPPNELPAAA